MTLPFPSGSVTTGDRLTLGGAYSGITPSPPSGTTLVEFIYHEQRVGYVLGFASILLFLFLLMPSALAAPCQAGSFYDGFSGQFFGTSTVTGFVYGLDETYLYVTLTNGKVSGFINVPQTTPSAFQHAANPDSYYANQVVGVYRQPIMTEDCQNILTEDDKYILAF